MVVDILDYVGIGCAVIVVYFWAGVLVCWIVFDYGDCVVGFVLFVPVMHFWSGGVYWYYWLVVSLLVGLLFLWIFVLLVGEVWMWWSIIGVFVP